MNSDRFEPDDAKADAIARRASDWIILEDRGLSQDERLALANWLDEDFRHGEAYRERVELWGKFVSLKSPGESRGIQEGSLSELSPAKSSLGRKLAPMLALAAMLAVSGLMWMFPDFKDGMESQHLPQRGVAQQYERHVLEDGSVVELNAGAQVSIHFSKEFRSLNLISGEAHFTVFKDKARPFLVRAGTATVRAVGTAFNVNRKDNIVEVIVTEGRVRLGSSDAALGQSDEPAKDTGFIELSEGQSSFLPTSEDAKLQPKLEAFSQSDMEERLDWKSPIIHFSSKPLSEVVSQFNRYNRIQLQFDDPKIGDRSITAALRMNNVDGFLKLLEAGMGIEARKLSNDTILLAAR